MAQGYPFNGRIFYLPGVESIIRSGIPNTPSGLESGGLTIIDTGRNAGWGGGRGISSATVFERGNKFYYYDYNSLRSAVVGGPLLLAARKLFAPGINNALGVNYIEYVRAATTTPATITIPIDTTSVVVETLEEGLFTTGVSGNGSTVNDANLSKGYGATVRPDANDSDRFTVTFYRATYSGQYEGAEIADPLENSPSAVVCVLENLLTGADFFERAASNPQFRLYFRLSTSTAPSESFQASNITSNDDTTPPYILATGGSETYNAAGRLDSLRALSDSVTNFILLNDAGEGITGARSPDNLSIINHRFKYPKAIWVGGAEGLAGVSPAVADARLLNNQNVRVVYDGYREAISAEVGLQNFSSYYKAAVFCGLSAGLPTQVPITLKGLSIFSNTHELTERERIRLTRGGVNYAYFDSELNRQAAGLGVNTLQRSDNLINSDGTSYSDQIIRIVSHLNKELSVNAKRDLLGDSQGVNIHTLSEADLIAYTDTFLQSRTASGEIDGPIIEYRNISAELDGNAWRTSYQLVLNREITNIFNTGYIVEGV